MRKQNKKFWMKINYSIKFGGHRAFSSWYYCQQVVRFKIKVGVDTVFVIAAVLGGQG